MFQLLIVPQVQKCVVSGKVGCIQNSKFFRVGWNARGIRHLHKISTISRNTPPLALAREEHGLLHEARHFHARTICRAGFPLRHDWFSTTFRGVPKNFYFFGRIPLVMCYTSSNGTGNRFAPRQLHGGLTC